MKKLLEYYLAHIHHRGKRYVVRWLLAVLRYKNIHSHYGPVMRINRDDKTNIYALSGEYGHVVSDHVSSTSCGDIFIDVGANYGLFSLLAAERVGLEGSVFSFEPNPQIYGFLLENIHLNKRKNIIPFHCAIGPTEGLMGLSFDHNHSGRSHLTEHGDFLVPVFNPAHWSFLSERIGARPVHIKIDVEGYEAEILKTLMQATWFSQVKSIVIEIDDDNLKEFGSNAQLDIYNCLKSVGLRPTVNGKTGTHYDEIFVR